MKMSATDVVNNILMKRINETISFEVEEFVSQMSNFSSTNATNSVVSLSDNKLIKNKPQFL